MISVRSNAYYTQQENQLEFSLTASLELVIIHTDGKEYKMNKKTLVSSPKVSEIRMIVNSELLKGLITDLQLHEKKLKTIRENSDALNRIAKHITTFDGEE